MKKNKLLLLLVGCVMLTQSCAPVYKCGEPKPAGNISGGSRLMAVVKERDALCEETKIKEEENVFLTEENQSLKLDNDSLITRNNELISEYGELEHTHNKLLTKHDNLRKEFTDLGERYSAMMSDNFERGYYYEEQVKNREAKLKAKEQELEDRQKRIQELERVIAEKDAQAQRLNELLREALLGFKSDELTIEIRDGKVYVSMSDKLMFKSGSANVESKGKEALSILANVIKQNKDFEISVEGHTDNVPIKTAVYADNWDLSVARATAMVRLLTNEHNISPKRLTASGRGEFDPKETNETAEGRAQNRRTEIILSPKLNELMKMLGD